MTFIKTLEATCRATTTEVFAALEDLGFTVVTGEAKGWRGEARVTRYAYRVGNDIAAPLVVCHADTVRNGGESPHKFSYNKKSNRVNSLALDDRLGIACMIDAIVNSTWMADCAMLVCDDEECGQSTASVFAEHVDAIGLKPRWMVELDRRGTDAVMYEYETELFAGLLRSVGFDIGSGSFSDICSLTCLGVCGFNIGIGYHSEHSDKCYANLDDTFSQLAKLEAFYKKFYDVGLVHEDTKTSWASSYRSKKSTASTATYADEPLDDWNDYRDAPMWNYHRGDSSMSDLVYLYGETMTQSEVRQIVGAENFDHFMGWYEDDRVEDGMFFTLDVEDFIRMYSI